MMLGSLITYCQYPTTKTIGKDSVVIITTEQAEIINRVHTKMIDSIKLIRFQGSMTAYGKLEALDKIEDLENRIDIYAARLKMKDSEYQNLKNINDQLKNKQKNSLLRLMLILVAWTIYIGVQTQTLK